MLETGEVKGFCSIVEGLYFVHPIPSFFIFPLRVLRFVDRLLLVSQKQDFKSGQTV